MAAHNAGGQAGRVGPHDADAVHIDPKQLGRAHAGGQIQRHIIPPAAVNVLYTVNFPRAQGREAGAGRQHIVLELPLGDLLNRALHAAQAAQLRHDKAEMNGGMPHGILVDQAVDRLCQRLNIQPAAAENIKEEVAQLLALERFGDLQHIMDLQTAPKLLCLAGLAHREKAAVQGADTGPGDDIRRPVQRLQGMPDTDLVAALGTAPRQHQRALSGMFHLRSPSRSWFSSL